MTFPSSSVKHPVTFKMKYITKTVYERFQRNDFASVLIGKDGALIYDTLNGGGHDHDIAVMYLLEYSMDGNSAAASKGFEDVVVDCAEYGDLYNVSRLLVCYAVTFERDSDYQELDIDWARVSRAVRNGYANFGHRYEGDVSVLLSIMDIERLFCRHKQL